LHARFRRDWNEIADKEDAEVLELLAADIANKAQEMGAAELLAWMEENLSNTVQISDRESVLVNNFEATAARLYRQHVLKEPKPQEVSGLQIQGLKKPAAPSDDTTEPVTTH